MIEEEGAKIVFLAKMSPLLPAEVFNYACSATSLTLREWSIGCIGSIVPMFFWVLTTAQATVATEEKNPKTSLYNFLIFFNVVLLAALTAMLYLSYSRFRDKERAQEEMAQACEMSPTAAKSGYEDVPLKLAKTI